MTKKDKKGILMFSNLIHTLGLTGYNYLDALKKCFYTDVTPLWIKENLFIYSNISCFPPHSFDNTACSRHVNCPLYKGTG